MSNPYKVFGITPDADEAVIKAVYRALCKKYHPDTCTGDKQTATAKMQEINNAYDILSDSEKRKEFDRQWNESDVYESAQQTERNFDSGIVSDEEWNFAVGYYPELQNLYEKLNIFSPVLASSFQLLVIEQKNFETPELLADELEFRYLKKYFGSNKIIRDAAKDFIIDGNRQAARELNKAVNLFGSEIEPYHIISKVRKNNPSKTYRSRKESYEINKGVNSFVIVMGFLLIFFIIIASISS